MNFIFVTVLIFILLVPGFLLRLAYFSAPFSRKFTGTNLIADLSWSIVPALILHFIGIGVVEHFSNYYFQFDYLGPLLLSITDKDLIKAIFLNIHAHLWPIFLYNLMLMGFAIVLGYLGKYLVRELKWDRKSRFFRFSNRWHYILTGECLDFKHIPDKYEDINFKRLDVLCQVGSKQFTYMGELIDWYLDEKGDLDMLHLRNVFKKEYGTTAVTLIPTRFFIVPNKNIININVRYFNVVIESSATGSAREATQ